MYPYLLALHIIFIVTWFSGMFYIVRLFIYTTEANERPEAERKILQGQFKLMSRRLWFGITWPSAVLTLIFGPWVLWEGGWLNSFSQQFWLQVKLFFVALLYLYFYFLHRIFSAQQKGIFRYSSSQLRVWNEIATVLLVAIVMLAVVKQAMSWLWALCGLVLFIGLLMLAIRIYKRIRTK